MEATGAQQKLVAAFLVSIHAHTVGGADTCVPVLAIDISTRTPLCGKRKPQVLHRQCVVRFSIHA